MSVAQTQREINQLDSEIARLEKKRAEIEQKEADREQKINTIKRSITKNTSLSTLSSKNRQIQSYRSDIVKLSKEKADTTKRIAEKRKNRVDKLVRLQKEEGTEQKKNNKLQDEILKNYERRIDKLTSQIKNQSSLLRPQPSSLTEPQINLIDEEYDVFISHAWEDKEEFVDEFVSELELLGIKAWYDKQRICWGDSMRAKIDEGLRKSRFGVVVISLNYIAEHKYWTKAELDGLFQLESVNGKTILPIWHKITKKEVMAYSSIIAGRLAMSTASMTSKEIADELVDLLNEMKKESSADEQA